MRQHWIRMLMVAGLAAGVGLVWAQGLKVGDSQVKAVFRQMNVPVEGQFKRINAKISFNVDQPAQAHARIEIDTGSFDLGPGAEDYSAETKQAEWFDVARHPQALFEARGAKPLGDGRYEVAGSLTIKGHTVALKAPFILSDSKGQLVFTGEVPISRLAFGIGAGEWKDTSVLADRVLVQFRIVTSRE